jgi:HK97 family phage prohead protease
MNRTKEYRFIAPDLNYADIAIEGDEKLLRGYAIVFNAESELLSSKTGNFREIIPTGCKITFDDCRSLWNHNTDMAIGAVMSGTLRLMPDQKGVYFELDPERLTREQRITIEKGEARMSFGFYANKYSDSVNSAGESLRVLTDITVFEISPVIFPAYSQTDVVLRHMETDDVTDQIKEWIAEAQTRTDEIIIGIDMSNKADQVTMVRTKLKLGLGLLK